MPNFTEAERTDIKIPKKEGYKNKGNHTLLIAKGIGEVRLDDPNGSDDDSNHHPVSAEIQNRDGERHSRGGCGCAGGGGVVGQRAVDKHSLCAVDFRHLQDGIVTRQAFRSGTVDQRVEIGAVVVILAPTLRVLLAETGDGQGIVLVTGMVAVVIPMGERIHVCAI